MRRVETHLSVPIAKVHWCGMGEHTHKYRGEEKGKKRDQCPNAVVERLKTEIKGAGI